MNNVGKAASVRLTPLATCVALVFSGVTLAVDALPTALPRASQAALVANLRTVTSCADDATAGTLRKVIATAGDNDLIDMTSLTHCAAGTITLALGEISVNHSGLVIQGPPSDAAGPVLTISADNLNRVFNVTGGPVQFKDLRIIKGRISNPGGTAAGGCIAAMDAVTIGNSRVEQCEAAGSTALGGGVFALGALTLTHSVLTGNTALASSTALNEPSIVAKGGAVYGYADITVSDSVVGTNYAVIGSINNPAITTMHTSYGGGIYASPLNAAAPQTVTISRSLVSDNLALYGGGIDTRGNFFGGTTVTIVDSSITLNQGPSGGGGLRSGHYSNVSISGCTFSDNTTLNVGGAILATGAGTMTISNSTISGNSADIGAGVNGFALATLAVRNSTIASNSARITGGVYAPENGAMALDSTIIANNHSTSVTYDANLNAFNPIVISGSHNIVTSNAASITFVNAPIVADPQLQALADNGGLTQTHALSPTSPAINAGSNPAALAFDQRGTGFARTVGAAPDIGAVESDVIFIGTFD